jgi:putative heme-binding domain-containing protein
MESGNVPPSLLSDKSLRTNLEKLAGNEARARLDLLVAKLPDADENLQKMLDQRRRLFDAGQADQINGEQLFAQLCATCHQLGGQGALVGPQLDGIGNRGAERLLEDILDPNRNVDTAFRTSTFVLKNGDVESGLFRREDGALIVIANSAGKEFTVNKSDVEARHESVNSLMPSNFSEALTQEQFNDLLAFLLEQR